MDKFDNLFENPDCITIENTAGLFLIVTAGAGVRFEGFEILNRDVPKSMMKISVPEKSFRYDMNGKELAGSNLADAVRSLMDSVSLGVNDTGVAYRIRKGDIWNPQKAEYATRDAMKAWLDDPDVFNYHININNFTDDEE